MAGSLIRKRKSRRHSGNRVTSGVTLAAAVPLFAVGILSMSTKTKAQVGPDPRLVAQLGKALFFEADLSNPKGMSCATCHNPDAGFSFPISLINQTQGPVPGAVPGRFGNRKPPTVSYTRFLPQGTPTLDPNNREYQGGLFYDGRVPNLTEQAKAPFLNPNEMNNTLHNVANPAAVVTAVSVGPNAALFKQVYGPTVFQQPTAQVYQLIAQSIAAWEGTPEVNPFTSKYDAFLEGRVALTAQEMNGLRLFTGSVTGRPGGPAFTKNAECSSCHNLAPTTAGHDLFTTGRYFNIGLPKNSHNPFYTMTDPIANPAGYNPLGYHFIDFGLGDFLYPLNGLPSGAVAQGDPLAIDGLFKTPTVRNVDKRPYPLFIKDYGHNGVIKSLKGAVHFYNTRNLTTIAGEVIDFTKPNPYLGLKGKPFWPTPEIPSAKTLINPAGHRTGPGRHIGNLGLTDSEENDLVAFLRALSDGYFERSGNTVPPPP